MTLAYTILDPTGNITALVTSPIPVSEQPKAAAALMAREPSVEQVGFFTAEQNAWPSLRMAGGEFCGNASMCAAALWADGVRLDAGTVALRVSGAAEPISVSLGAPADGVRRASVTMPRPIAVTTERHPVLGDFIAVRFDGIIHAVVEGAPDRAAAEALIPSLCGALKADALGLMFLEPDAGRMTPLVYVPAAGTLFWESSCASGTTAAGVYLAQSAGRAVTASLAQPGGTLTVEAVPGGTPVLTGTVKTLHSGTITT